MTHALLAQVQLHFWWLTQPETVTAAAGLVLSEDEQARAARFVYDRDRVRYINGRAMLRRVLGEAVGQDAADLVFEYGRAGKPSLAGGPQFNLSHTGDLACLAIHPDLPIGADVERIKDIEHGVADRFFSSDEVEELNALPADQWEQGFFRCWTRKEAVVKLLGDGLSMPLDAFSVTLSPGRAARMVRIDTQYGHADDWTFAPFEAGKDYLGAIAMRGVSGIQPIVVSQPDDLEIRFPQPL